MIKLLDPETIGQIAAGEVIERPASVVKELVENALDANAHRIVVRIIAGGLREIEVADDGEGVPADQLALAVRRHATSKLEQTDDLRRVTTLGFRGEGLASIASVAKLEVTSRTADSEIGARIEAHGEQIGEVHPIPAPPGTRVVARELFANVPVRREFLKSIASEFGRISTWLGTIALAYPDTTFSLEHDGREIWILPAGEVVPQRLAHVFGPQLARGMVPLITRNGPSTTLGTGAHEIGLSGFISAPGNDRGDRRLQQLFVNRRLLRGGLLAGAWSTAYATFAMAGRHPYGVLFLSLPPDHVDPNVHPTKSDVRLRYDRAVFEVVRDTLASSLREHARERLAKTISFAPSIESVATNPEAALQARLFAHEPFEAQASSNGSRILAQLDATYILATDGDALILVDQHAAHERIALEAIERNATTPSPPSEPLLVPVEFELDAAQSQSLDSALDLLRAGGLDIEPFGERVYRIVGTPAGYRWSAGSRGFDVADFLLDLDEDGDAKNYRERVWSSLACHSVVRAGERLTELEMRLLVDQLAECRNPMHCAHGRPTIVRLESEAIARLFKRT